MIINFRYHVVTLVAIFMALTVGIFIGSFLQGDDVVMEQQELLVERIEDQLTVLNEENQQLQLDYELVKQQDAYFKQFEQNVFPFLVDGILTEHKVALINTGNQEIPASLSANLSLAGAKVDLVINIKDNLNLSDTSALLEKLNWTPANVLNPDLEAGADSEDSTPITPDLVRSRLLQEIVRVILAGDQTGFWNKLNGLDLIETEGEASGSITTIILLGGNSSLKNSKLQTLDAPLIQYCNAAGVRVCGSETSTAPYSYMSDYQALGLSTVDNLDYLSGQYSAILVLAGANGNYGIKTTAQALIPDRSVLNSY
ncbi:MAG: copper transporter [Clostridia bacterium]|nr:copper transporter [Clostridia bacterium]